MSKYRLCRVEVDTRSSIYPLDDDGEEIATASMVEFSDGDDYYYAIYENLGTEDMESWSEYACYGDDKQKAIEEYQALIDKEGGSYKAKLAREPQPDPLDYMHPTED